MEMNAMTELLIFIFCAVTFVSLIRIAHLLEIIVRYLNQAEEANPNLFRTAKPSDSFLRKDY